MEATAESKKHDQIAIGTLALGDEFVLNAILLANDLHTYHPDNKFFILTDKPDVFAGFDNVVAIKHNFSGVRRCYHDKRFVIEKMLQQHETCFFMDADSRLLSKIDFDELLNEKTFITTLHSKNLQEKLLSDIEMKNRKAGYRYKLLKSLANKICANFSKAVFVQESHLIFQSRYGDIEKFFYVWDFCAAYTTMRLFEFSEGSSIGLSAEATKAKIFSLEKNPNWLFKDLLTNYTYKNLQEIAASEQLIIVRKALEINSRKKTYLLANLPAYVIRYCKNIKLYFHSKKNINT